MSESRQASLSSQPTVCLTRQVRPIDIYNILKADRQVPFPTIGFWRGVLKRRTRWGARSTYHWEMSFLITYPNQIQTRCPRSSVSEKCPKSDTPWGKYCRRVPQSEAGPALFHLSINSTELSDTLEGFYARRLDMTSIQSDKCAFHAKSPPCSRVLFRH